MYLQKAADLWHEDAVKSIVSLYRSGFCRECFGKSALKAAAKEWKDSEKGIAYGLEAEKHGIDAAWELMLAYEAAENHEQAFHWAKVHDSRAGNEEAAQRLAKQGHAEAQYDCGVRYQEGAFTEANEERALYWYEEAAQQGHAAAQSALRLLADDQK